jgi:hypothetical protein
MMSDTENWRIFQALALSNSKADWELWTAASTNVASLRQFFIDALYLFYIQALRACQ